MDVCVKPAGENKMKDRSISQLVSRHYGSREIRSVFRSRASLRSPLSHSSLIEFTCKRCLDNLGYILLALSQPSQPWPKRRGRKQDRLRRETAQSSTVTLPRALSLPKYTGWTCVSLLLNLLLPNSIALHNT